MTETCQHAISLAGRQDQIYAFDAFPMEKPRVSEFWYRVYRCIRFGMIQVKHIG